MVTFRPIEVQDIQTICEFPQSKDELFFLSPKASFPLRTEDFKKIIAERVNPTVAVANEQIVGFSSLYKVETEKQCFIGNVIVSPAVRGAGLGKAIIENMIILGREQHKIKEIHLSCFSNNINGLLLYSKLGFAPYSIEERINFNNERVALIHMKKTT